MKLFLDIVSQFVKTLHDLLVDVLVALDVRQRSYFELLFIIAVVIDVDVHVFEDLCNVRCVIDSLGLVISSFRCVIAGIWLVVSSLGLIAHCLGSLIVSSWLVIV